MFPAVGATRLYHQTGETEVLARLVLMFVVVATLCGAAFTLGSTSSGGRQDASGIPSEHPVILALHYQRELELTDLQIQKLNAMRDAMGIEFAPLHEQADAIQRRMQELQQSSNPDQEAGAKLKKDADALGAKMQPLFERYAHEVGNLLTDEQRQKLMKSSNASGHPSDGQEFVLNTIMQSRDQLGVTPQQFTKLQYLLADFIRAFAPVREKMELLQLEIQDKFAKAGKAPTPEYVERAREIQKQVAALQSQFSEQAAKGVLEPDQRAKLEELLHGEHRSTPDGG
jgi:Spy/CpxP family protein refolding chaperone